MSNEVNSKAAEGMYAGIDVVLEVMEKRIDPSLKLLVGRRSAREQYIMGFYYLAKSWLKSLKKLNEPKDVQAIMAANRALVEIAVDVILLYKDTSRGTIRKMLHFDRYQKYKLARALVEYFQKNNQVVPAKYAEIEAYYYKKKYKVERKKQELWPKHTPRRWSGNNLLKDIQEADHLLGHAIREELGMSIEQYHETEYRRLHWYVHGSGLSGYWNMPTPSFHLICAFGFYWSCNFAMLCSKVVLAAFHIPVVTELEEDWARVRLARNTMFLDLNPHYQSEEGAKALEAAKKMLGFGVAAQPAAEGAPDPE